MQCYAAVFVTSPISRQLVSTTAVHCIGPFVIRSQAAYLGFLLLYRCFGDNAKMLEAIYSWLYGNKPKYWQYRIDHEANI